MLAVRKNGSNPHLLLHLPYIASPSLNPFFFTQTCGSFQSYQLILRYKFTSFGQLYVLALTCPRSLKKFDLYSGGVLSDTPDEIFFQYLP
jgi:hypothetical protein